MLAMGILLLLLGIPSFLFLILYAIYEYAKFRREQRKQEEFYSDRERALEDATHDRYGQIVMPEWFKEKYPKGILSVWGIE